MFVDKIPETTVGELVERTAKTLPIGYVWKRIQPYSVILELQCPFLFHNLLPLPLPTRSTIPLNSVILE